MFINKLVVQASASTNRMSNYIYKFLHAELTCIPGEINKIIENYYSNAHCNGATWLFFLWNVLHVVYDKCLHAFLRRLKFKQHVCSRIKDSLWYLGFSGTVLIYCGATLALNEMELFNFKRMHVPSDTNLSDQVVLGYTLICTFYLHTAFWEGIKNGSLSSFIKYLFLAFLCIFSYILRILEVMYSLTGLISITQVATELTRLIYSLSRKNTYLSSMLIFGLFALTLGLYVLLQLIVIPLTFAVPLGLKILSDYPNVMLICLYCSLLVWLVLDIYKSVVLNFFDHWLYHSKANENVPCTNKFLECALFQPRNDDAYHLQILRKEMKERQQELISRRKPKNRSMLVQTLKCMVAIKRKLNQKRLSESSDSEDSEKSDELIRNEDVSDISVDGNKGEDRSSDEGADKESDDSSDCNKIVINSERPSGENRIKAGMEDYSNNEDSCDEISDGSSKDDTDISEKSVRENIAYSNTIDESKENDGDVEEKRSIISDSPPNNSPSSSNATNETSNLTLDKEIPE
ncbi:uncharacterized protein LOC132701380 [Cylas formicarius]|uniref:uncharacterized protein LOC132701380 n=1 Tax=Cylas formicarius TaxID=197179 RepID=UPI00295833DC|nr:uncharacterized protein LOC132701380 [Cylas formicarius]